MRDTKSRFSLLLPGRLRQESAIFVATIVGLLMLLIVPIGVRLRIEQDYRRIETEIAPARDHIVSALETAREARFVAVSYYLRLPSQTTGSSGRARSDYEKLVRDWKGLSSDSRPVAPAGSVALAAWRQGTRHLDNWLENDGRRYFDSPASLTEQDLDRADVQFRDAVALLGDARRITERQQIALRNSIVTISARETMVIAPMTVLCLLLASLAWRNYRSIRRSEVRLLTAVRETHHRVKNNLQVIGSLIEIQKMEARDPSAVAALQDIGRQLGAMATVHDLLSHTPEGGVVEGDDLLTRLGRAAANAAGIDIAVDAEHAPLTTAQATALALITNELILNAGKHGARHARVHLRTDGRSGTLIVCDDGPGYPPDFIPERDGNLGLSLVTTLAQHDLGGHIRFHTDHGAHVDVTFPVTRR